ncbi:MAG: hypothetical protein HXY40_09310 [Chloroflexi bacterium]|nr:hypothetical protein [Chloroflexota bacterium]
MLDLRTIRLGHIWSAADLSQISPHLNKIAFIVCHKDEPAKFLWRVLWYLPADSPIIVVTNCPETEFDTLRAEVREHLPQHQHIRLIHQKDPCIADYLRRQNVMHILGDDGRVVNGKGEGMYIGTLLAAALGSARHVAFYDADNHAPSTLLAYTLALARLFSLPRKTPLHNVRICWPSKPDMTHSEGTLHDNLGRCTRVVSPLFDRLIADWFGGQRPTVISSNAGEQALTMTAARALRFASGYAVETFHLIELLFKGHQGKTVRVDQYLSQTPFFHTKKDHEHINRMIASSLGAFMAFREHLPHDLLDKIDWIEAEIGMTARLPRLYPPIGALDLATLDIRPYALAASRA